MFVLIEEGKSEWKDSSAKRRTEEMGRKNGENNLGIDQTSEEEFKSEYATNLPPNPIRNSSPTPQQYPSLVSESESAALNSFPLKHLLVMLLRISHRHLLRLRNHLLLHHIPRLRYLAHLNIVQLLARLNSFAATAPERSAACAQCSTFEVYSQPSSVPIFLASNKMIGNWETYHISY